MTSGDKPTRPHVQRAKSPKSQPNLNFVCFLLMFDVIHFDALRPSYNAYKFVFVVNKHGIKGNYY